MDENFLERADELTRSTIDAAVEKCRQKPMPEGFDGDCDCGATVSRKRISLGYYTCLACQEEKERRLKFFRPR